MNYVFEGSVANKLEKSPETSVTVFSQKAKEDRWEKMLDPFYAPETGHIPKITYYKKSVTISIALNHPIGDKACKVLKVENGTCNGPTKVGNFKWEIELVSDKETGSPQNPTVMEVEITE